MESDDFKKKLEELARQRAENAKKAQEQAMHSLEANLQRKITNIKAFQNFKQEIVYKTLSEVRSIFESTGDSIQILDNEHSSWAAEKTRQFCQIFYYFKHRPSNIAGKNTSNLLFELDENSGIVTINETIRPISVITSPRKVEVANLTKPFFQEQLLAFLDKITK